MSVRTCAELDTEIRRLRVGVLSGEADKSRNTQEERARRRQDRREITRLVQERESRFGRCVRQGRHLRLDPEISLVEVLGHHGEMHLILLGTEKIGEIKIWGSSARVSTVQNPEKFLVDAGVGSWFFLRDSDREYWLGRCVSAVLDWRTRVGLTQS